MLTPEQFQDLSIIFDTPANEIEEMYKTSDVDITDELAIADVLSDEFNETDVRKLQEILQNYPLFDTILLKIKIVEQVLNINSLNKVHIFEYLTPKVIKQFDGTPLKKIFESIDNSLSDEEKNKVIKDKILEAISPKAFLKSAISGMKTRKKVMNESSSIHMSKSLLKSKITSLYEELYHKTPLYAQNKNNINWYNKLLSYKNMKKVYESIYGEGLVEPIKPIETDETNSNSSNNVDSNVSDETSINSTNTTNTNTNTNSTTNKQVDTSNMIKDPSGKVNVEELKKTIEDMDDDDLSNLYKDMDDDELAKQMKAIEELMK